MDVNEKSDALEVGPNAGTGGWLAIARKNLLPKSLAQDFKTALSEWRYEPPPIDNEIADEHCELCEHENLRWHYRILNKDTHEQMLVGSTCILRFGGIEVQDDEGQSLTTKSERRAKLASDLRTMRVEKMLNCLRNLYRKIPKTQIQEREKLVHIVERFNAKGGFSVRELLWLLRKLDRAAIKVDEQLFSVRLRSEYDQNQLRSLEDNSFIRISRCLSQQQWIKYARPHLSQSKQPKP